MGNPEKIEIEGLKTIHKLCKFGADHNMEGCTFTEIVERMFSKIEQMKTQVNTLDEMLLNQGEALAQAKSQAVPEGFVLVPREMPESFDNGLYAYSNNISIVDSNSDGFIPMSDINHAEVWKLVVEAQEPAND